MFRKKAQASAAADELRLSEELAAIDKDYPGWHAWKSDAGRLWATHASTRAEMRSGRNPGYTLDAETPDGLRRAIAVQIHDWARAA